MMTDAATETLIPAGIAPLDERAGGLEAGGLYLITGSPGPAKMVALFHFLDEGLRSGEPGLLLTGGDPESIIQVAAAWGFDFRDPWLSGDLRILGFRDDFELRALRTVEPRDVIDELDRLVPGGVARVAVDPGSMFLASEARSLLGTTFLNWGRRHSATLCATLSSERAGGTEGAVPDWVVPAITGALVVQSRSGGLHQITLAPSVPGATHTSDAVTVELKPGRGLVVPEGMPSRRAADRDMPDRNRLLFVSLGDAHPDDLEAWARDAFRTTIVSEPFAAVSRLQADRGFGSVLVHAPRDRIREATQACRAIRPLTRAVVLFASDDALRSTDRIRLLEAGADDCLSGGIDFRELKLRFHQASARGVLPPAETGEPASASSDVVPEGGLRDFESFVNEVRRRMDHSGYGLFSLVDVRGSVVSAESLRRNLTSEVRDEDGDLLTTDGDRTLVLLQGARERQTNAILDRLRARLTARGDKAELATRVASHPSDPAGVERILEASGASVD